MLVLSRVTHGAALVAALGAGHTVAYVIGAIALGAGCIRRTGRSLFPRHLPAVVAVSVLLALGVWFALRAVAPEGRLTIVAWLAAMTVGAAAVYSLAMRLWWRTPHVVATKVEL